MTTSAPAFARLTPILAAVAAGIALAFSAATAQAQTPVTLDGTSGSNAISTAYTLSDDTTTTFDLGFFADYLIVGGGGGGGGTPDLGAGGGGGGGRVLKYVTGETGNTGADPLQLGSTSYGITVGAGGAGGEGLTGAQPAAASGRARINRGVTGPPAAAAPAAIHPATAAPERAASMAATA
jgi:hypothetical protein